MVIIVLIQEKTVRFIGTETERKLAEPEICQRQLK